MGDDWAVRTSLREASTLQGHEAPHVGQHAWAGLLDNEETDVIWSWVTLCSDVVGTPFKLRILIDMNYGYYTVRDRCHVVLSYAILWCRCYFYAKNTLCYELWWRTDVIWSWIMLCFNVDTTLWNYVLSRAWGCEWKFFLWLEHPQTLSLAFVLCWKSKDAICSGGCGWSALITGTYCKACLRGTTATNVQY